MKFEKQTYTQTPNSLFLMMKDMDECELKVVLLICRYTFGYHREEVKLSTRRIADEIGMNTASVSKGAERAIGRGLIEKVIDGNKTTLWRALVSDSEIESQVIQKLNRGVSENESLLGIKESNKENKHTAFMREEQERPDKMEAYLSMVNSPAVKKTVRVDNLLSAWAVAFTVKTTAKDWTLFARYAIDMQDREGWEPEVFIKWVKGQEGYPQFWSRKRMEENYPKAYAVVSDTKPANDFPVLVNGRIQR